MRNSEFGMKNAEREIRNWELGMNEELGIRNPPPTRLSIGSVVGGFSFLNG